MMMRTIVFIIIFCCCGDFLDHIVVSLIIQHPPSLSYHKYRQIHIKRCASKCHYSNTCRRTSRTDDEYENGDDTIYDSYANIGSNGKISLLSQKSATCIESNYYGRSPLSLTYDELANFVGGFGRASYIWECFRDGIDPMIQTNLIHKNYDSRTRSEEQQNPILQSVGQKTIRKLHNHFGEMTFQNNIARVVERSISSDGTTKLLIELVRHNHHYQNTEDDVIVDTPTSTTNFMVETVIIPWPERNTSTVCVSSQVGCRQACTFCRTGQMGKLTDLTTDEILVQVLYSIREVQQQQQQQQYEQNNTNCLHVVDNIVFMGMGEPADNANAVVRAANILTDPNQFRFSPRRVTISTIAPTPESFHKLGQARALLAWSVHASHDTLRQQLVPTTKYPMTVLRDDGLRTTLLKRSKNGRAVMFEVTLLKDINDTPDAAIHLALFCQPLIETVPGMKLIVNLIPWNDINAKLGPASFYEKPSIEQVRVFQETFLNTINKIMEVGQFNKRSVVCFIRTTRGDEESAACGQLATNKPSRYIIKT